jgi:hypothetical protein
VTDTVADDHLDTTREPRAAATFGTSPGALRIGEYRGRLTAAGFTDSTAAQIHHSLSFPR